MKKLILSSVGIAAAFAFTPIQKNGAIKNSSILDDTVVFGTCDSRYQTSDGFTVCDREFKEEELESLAMQMQVLNKY